MYEYLHGHCTLTLCAVCDHDVGCRIQMKQVLLRVYRNLQVKNLGHKLRILADRANSNAVAEDSSNAAGLTSGCSRISNLIAAGVKVILVKRKLHNKVSGIFNLSCASIVCTYLRASLWVSANRVSVVLNNASLQLSMDASCYTVLITTRSERTRRTGKILQSTTEDHTLTSTRVFGTR